MQVYIDPRNIYNPPRNDNFDGIPTMPYEDVVAAAEKGPVDADFFRPFIGHRNWLVVDAGDLPGADSDFAGISTFFVRRVDLKSNKVQVGVMYNAGVTFTWVAIWYDADELAIRIEAS